VIEGIFTVLYMSHITSLHVYIKGAGSDIAKEASKQPIQFSRRLSQIVGAVGKVKLS